MFSGESPFPNPTLQQFFSAHDELVQSLADFSLAHTVALVGGMLTMPEFQSSTIRLEILQHLVVSEARGLKWPRSYECRSWLNELGDGYPGRLEDPAEDVFVSRVSGPQADYLIFEGLYEGSAFYLQRFLDVLADMPDDKPFNGLRRAIYAVLAIGNETVCRASLSAHVLGAALPLQTVSGQLARQANRLADRVVYTADDLEQLGIDENDLGPFIFDFDSRSELRDESFGHSSLDRNPLLRFDEKLYLALPTTVSMAIRRLIIEFCISHDNERQLYRAYTRQLGRILAEIPILNGRPATEIPFQPMEGLLVSNLARYVDAGRLLHFCFVVDDFAGYADSGVVEPRPDGSQISSAINSSIRLLHDSFNSKAEFREGLTLVVLCMWGRPIAAQIDRPEDPRWRVDTISAADLEAIGWTSSFSPHVFWSLLDGLDALANFGVRIINVNGLLNLFAWSESLDGHLVPHAQLSDEASGQPLIIYIPQNSLLDIRRRGALAWDVHRAKTWDGRVVRVRRFRDVSFFKEDADVPLYVSLDDAAQKQLVAVYKSAERAWWLTIDAPKNLDRDIRYRLWHALVTWLERAAPILDSQTLALPKGQIAWICSFEDTNPADPGAPLPSPAQARELLNAEVDGNIVRVTARQGFLDSFRHPTNIGERLLVEAFVGTTTTLSSERIPDDKVRKLLDEIIPDEWARDMHLFPAQRFRDFVGHKNRPDILLIEKADDALSRIGLGWRARSREEGSQVLGIDACCAYLNDVVERIWKDIKTTLKNFDREKMLISLVANHEAVTMESDRWLRSARALVAFRRQKEEAAEAAANRIARFNAASLSGRVLMEMVLCECPDGGAGPGRIDISRLMANVMQIHFLGGWSDAIRYGCKEAEVKIRPIGDIHTNVEFDEAVATPYGLSLGLLRFRDSADNYERHFLEEQPIANSQGRIDDKFWNAWVDQFGFTIDELRAFMDNLDNEGIRRNKLLFVADFDEIASLHECGQLSSDTVRAIIDLLALKPRSTWASTPSGFQPRDWYPWRFRRRLSAVSRPILALHDDGPFIIAPGMIRDGAAKVIDYCYNGGYEAKDFPRGLLRSWIGASENRRGHEFNEKVANLFESFGWEVRVNIKLTEILNTKLDRDYGDIDVLAWNGSRVLAVECKDLELAMTNSDIARQLYDFRGEFGPNGKPDRLKRHLLRADVLNERTHDLATFVRLHLPVSLEVCLVFSQIVPMHYTNIADNHNIRITTVNELECI